MPIHRRRQQAGATLLALSLLLTAVAIGLGLTSVRADAAAGMDVDVSPTGGAVDGQFLSVTWEGFPPSGGVVIRQCKGGATSWTQCSQQLQNEISRDNGTGSATYQVIATNGSDRTLPGAPSIRCDYQNPCDIYVLPNASAQDLAGGASASVAFAKPATACPPPGSKSAVGEGTDAAARAISSWQSSVCEKPTSTTIDYTLKNDPSGRRDFQCGLRDFAVSASNSSSEDVCNPGDKLRGSVAAPVSVSALGFAFNVRDLRTNQRILDLKLTPQLLAEIFTGQIRSWNDPRIAALNPDYTLPTKLRVVGRADRSAANLMLTTYFWENAQASYLAGGEAFQGGPTDTYPSVLSIDLRTYGPAVAEQVARPTENDPRTDPTYGFIGILDTSVAALYGLPVAAIGDPGSGFISPNAGAMQAGLEGMQVTKDGTLFPDVTPETAGAYPLTTVSYTLMPTDQVSDDVAVAIKTFVAHAVTKGQSGLPAGYIPLTDELADEAVAAIDKVPGPDVKIPGEPPPDQPPGGESGLPPGGDESFGGDTGFTDSGLTDVDGASGPGDDVAGDDPNALATTEVSYLFDRDSLAKGPIGWVVLGLISVGALVSMIAGSRMLRRQPGGV